MSKKEYKPIDRLVFIINQVEYFEANHNEMYGYCSECSHQMDIVKANLYTLLDHVKNKKTYWTGDDDW